MSDKARAARRAVADYRRSVLWGRTTNPAQLARWVEILADEIETNEDHAEHS